MSEANFKERPILFSAPMVRAIRDGRKTQTRRIIKHQPRPAGEGCWWVGENLKGLDENYFTMPELVTEWYFDYYYAEYGAPHGCVWADGPADRLWVKEAVEVVGHDLVFYPATRETMRVTNWQECEKIWLSDRRKRTAMFMPRWASRLTLELTEVRTQRLQDITEADAIAEGTQAVPVDSFKPPLQGCLSERAAYRQIWERINGKGAWDRNDWCWVYDFKVASALTPERAGGGE